MTNWRKWKLSVNAKSEEELADYLETIAGMIREGYTSGIDSPTIWDLKEPN